MKLAARMLLLISLAVTLAFAQNQYIKNVIVVIEENRTPDNLFQAMCNPATNNCGTGSNQFNLQSTGLCLYQGHDYQVPLKALTLINCSDPGHGHIDWTTLYNSNGMGGGMDGACARSAACTNGSLYQCPSPFSQLDCTRYSFVDNSSGVIQPYLDIAAQYGWANYMFQTNQGPSFPAHQFLISGTSAPDSKMVPLYSYFAVGNPSNGNDDAGCAASSGTTETLISPTGDESINVYPCFEHPTLTDLLDSATPPIPWRYYSGLANSIWTAPNAISHICNNDNNNHGCGTLSNPPNHDWANNVAPFLERSPTENTLAPLLNDLLPGNCNFPANWPGGVIFVVPDGRWSDHPQDGVGVGAQRVGLGADWVANIVNAIGLNNCTTGNQPNWSNTVILITWDDWGGWYDHVLPYNYSANGGKGGYTNGTGEQYVYGFRVPLLVVSEWVKSDSGLGGHISNVDHDFGSILSFIEQTYGITSNVYPAYEYADFFAPDNPSPLSDFFCFPPTCQTPPHATFQQIGLYNNPNVCNASKCMSNNCDAKCFINYTGMPNDPDTY